MSEDDLKFDDDEGLQSFTDLQIPPKRELVTYPYDPPVKTIVREISDKELIVNPEFQRKSVWDRGRKSRLIESLLLNIPIPVCFFAEDEDGRKVVVDGQQRLRAIEEFISGQYALYGLQVLSDLNRKRWTDLSPRQARIIENRVIRCIVISESSDPAIRFEVFERLNTGVVPLTDQELRNCVYRGSFNKKLNELARHPNWLQLLRKSKPDNRLRHHELVLRYLTFLDRISQYRPPLKHFLSEYMREYRHADTEQLNNFESAFKKAVSSNQIIFGDKAFRRASVARDGSIKWDNAINRAILDIQMFSGYWISENSLYERAKEIRKEFVRLCTEDSEFSDAITKATADRAKVLIRFRRYGQLLRRTGLDTPWLDSLPET